MNILLKSLIDENAFDGAPAGGAGSIAYGPTYGTFASPEVSQNSANFAHSDNNKAPNQKGVGTNSNTTNNPSSGSLDKEINKIFQKKDTPTPDEVITGIKYEMQNMIKKDIPMAKQIVMGNLIKDPHYYSKLHMWNIDDKHMQVNVNETKKVLEQMFEKHVSNKFVVNSNIVEAMKDTQKKFDEKNAWRQSDASRKKDQ